ncbi:hypothetical protein PH235_10545 [Trichococcus sp. K1Tr]|uniref:hypothetical protein n=1 Tax=Trichococcus sp. K1Tr TaxID=3020847 RepID=UPI00232EBA31|nr:hypothetical protein [Trichococcus sp. K1Tr]MDB6353997.1 hypothetical protein [Trichococcus sp. K1Tr]
MAETEKERKARVIADSLAEKQPATPKAHAITFAFLNATEGVTQLEYAKALNISDRTVRKYISGNRADYDAEYSRSEAELKQALGRSKQRAMTGSELDTFTNVLIERALDPKGSTQDRKLLIEFTGLNGKDLVARTAQKKTSLHWFILNSLSTVSGYMDTRALGIQLTETGLLNRETRDSEENLQRFTDSSIFTDPAFFREATYWGLVFMSMYNEVQHPDLELLSDAVRLERIIAGPADTVNPLHSPLGANVYAEGKDYHKRVDPITDKEFEDMLTELNEGPNVTRERAREQARETMRGHKNAVPALNSIKNVEAPARENVIQRVTDASELLELHLTAGEWLTALNNPGKRKEY